MKKFFSITLVISILLLPFCSLSASAFGLDSVLEFALGWLVDTSKDISDGSNGTGTDLINWFNSPEGQIYLKYLQTNPFFKQYGDYLNGYVQDANGAWYSVAEMKNDQVNLLFDTLNAYWSSDTAPIRNVTLSSLGINTFDYTVQYCGYLRGTNGIVSTDTRDDKNVSFYSEYDSAITNTTIFVYPGSSRFPPVITTGVGTNIGISGYDSGAVGQFVILNTSGDSFYLDKTGLGSRLQFYYIDGDPDHFDALRNSWIWPQIWTSGNKLTEYSDFDAPYALDLFTKSVGLHICPDPEKPVTPPEDIPYDDNNTVIVLVPLSEPSEPVYLAPNVFNNYLADNTYMTYNEGDTVVNNVTNDTMIQEFTNVYNNNTTNNNTSGGDGSSYDDTNLINRLSNWFSSVISKLDEIINKLPPSSNNQPSSSYTSVDSDNDSDDTGYGLPKWLKWLEPEPIYINFGDCIINNIPIITTIQTMAEDMKPTSSTSGLTDIEFEESGTQSGIKSYFSGAVIDLSWYYPYRERIRNLLKIPCYIMGLGAIWIAIKSIFGIHTAGGAE